MPAPALARQCATLTNCFGRCFTSALSEHFTYISDTIRTEQWRLAVESAVPPGAVVVDLGSGTGILGLFALRAGAAKVYAIEYGAMADIAVAIAKENGFDSRIISVRGMSTAVDIPEKADVLIADQIGYFGFNAGAFTYFADACRRFLKPGGIVLPHSITLQCAPVEAPKDFRKADMWRHAPEGFSMNAAWRDAVNTAHSSATMSGAALLATPLLSAALPLNPPSEDLVRLQGTVEITRDGILHGLAGFFSAVLAPGIEITNAPGVPHRIERAVSFLPIEAAVPVCAGDFVDIKVMVRPVEMLLSWTVTVNGATFRQSTFHSLPAAAFARR